MEYFLCIVTWIFSVTNSIQDVELSSVKPTTGCTINILIMGPLEDKFNDTLTALQTDLYCSCHTWVSFTHSKDSNTDFQNYDVVIATKGSQSGCSTNDPLVSDFSETGPMCIDSTSSSDLSIFPPYTQPPQYQQVSDFLQRQLYIQGWQTKIVHLIIGSTDTEGFSRMVLDVMENLSTMVQLYTVNNYVQIQSMIKEIFTSDGEVDDFTRILLLADMDEAIMIFSQVKALVHQKQIVHSLESEWLLVTLDDPRDYSDHISQLMTSGNIDNVAILELLPKLSLYCLQPNLEAIRAATYWKSLQKCESHCFDCYTCNGSLPANTCDVIRFQNSSLMKVVKHLPLSSYHDYRLYTSEWTLDGPILNIVPSHSLSKPVDLFPLKLQGLNGRHFMVGTLESSPFVMHHSNKYYGMCMDMLQELSVIMNFTYTITRSPDGEFGVPENNTWTGLIGALVNDDIDVAVASLTASPSRLQVVDFVNYFWEFGSILVRMPQKEDNAYKVIMQPFHGYLWIAVFIAVPIAGFVAWILSFTLTSYARRPQECFFRYGDSLWYVVGALLTQGGNEPKLMPTRCFIGCWWLFSVVIVAAYGGSLYSFLTINLNVIPFDNGEEMIRSNYKWGTTGGSFYVTELQNAKGGIFQDMWKGMEKFSRTDSEVLSIEKDVHFTKVKRGGYAFITDRTPLQRQAAEDRDCELTVLNYRFKPMPLGVALKQKSPFKRMFAKSILKLQESGLLVNWQQKWWPKSACQGLAVAEGSAISLLDIQSAFYVLMTGVCLACTALLFEALNKHSSLWRTLGPW